MTSESDSGELERRLRTLKPEVAALYVATRARLADRLNPRQREEWAEVCAQLSFAGWHTWEATRGYVAVSEPLLGASNPQVLLECGRYGALLASISHEPAAAYFRGIATLVERDALPSRLPWQEAADLIGRLYPRPSSVLAEYLRAGGTLLRERSTEELAHWIDLAVRFAETDLAGLRRFLAVSRQEVASHISWRYGKHLEEVSTQSCIEFLERYQAIARAVGSGSLPAVEQLVLTMAPDEDATLIFLEALIASPASFSEETMAELLHCCGALAEISPLLVNSFVLHFGELPQLNGTQFRTWFETGREIARRNVAAGEAFFALASATSIDLLSELSGKVHFADMRRVFELYSEGICGLPLRVEELDPAASGARALPGSDGERVYLPAEVQEFASTERNLSLYRLALLHQLGFYECGTFRFEYGDEADPYAAWFARFDDPSLAAALFRYLEDGRIDRHLSRRYRGAARELDWLMREVRESRPTVRALLDRGWPVQTVLLESVLQLTLGATEIDLPGLAAEVGFLEREVSAFLDGAARVDDTMACVERCYAHLDIPALRALVRPELPDVYYRGRIDPGQVAGRLQAVLAQEVLLDLEDCDKRIALSDLLDRSQLRITELVRGKVKSSMGVLLTELEKQLVEGEAEPEDLDDRVAEVKGQLRILDDPGPRTPETFYYDEWDYLIGDYRRRWCRLFEIRVERGDERLIGETLQRNKALLVQIRRQLQMLRPGQLRKVKGMEDGEDIDLERAVELVSDRRSGVSPNDRIYVQRLRRERDVAALFLLDMSASTDDPVRVPEPETEVREAVQPAQTRDDFLEAFYGPRRRAAPRPARRRIIDVERESVALMAEALQDLGDSYSICGFSGYGRDQVDYYVCKDFDEKYDDTVKGRLSEIKPYRSTRMGPAIRHAARQLERTEARIKTLIIISDGYPQDHDYGEDRTEREYGIQDTTKALAEVRQKGIQTFCLTVDPSGHDYLREMCRDQNYMVIQDINQLPNELSKVYQGLTA